MVYFEVGLCVVVGNGLLWGETVCGCGVWYTLRWDCVWLWGMVYSEVRQCVVVGNGLLWGETMCGCREWSTVRWECLWLWGLVYCEVRLCFGEWFTVRWDCVWLQVMVYSGVGTMRGCWALFALRWDTSHKKISNHHVYLKRSMSWSNFKPGYGVVCSSVGWALGQHVLTQVQLPGAPRDIFSEAILGAVLLLFSCSPISRSPHALTSVWTLKISSIGSHSIV